jgi:tetratricopeptide (TPR) repeat protein
LLHLWDAAPQDSTINLALARLAARRGSIDDALRYYHNAIYGVWTSDPDQNRRKTRFELIEFLLKSNAWPQAQAELLALKQILPPDPAQRIKVAELFAAARAYQDALAEYGLVLKGNSKDAAALAGAGESAFQLGHYRTAVHYLEESAKQNPDDPHTRQRLRTAKLVLETDPFLRRISDVERNRRITSAFLKAGDRLKSCAQANGFDLNSPADNSPGGSNLALSGDLPSLWKRWQEARADLRRISAPSNADLPDTLMDIVFRIEQQTALACGEPEGVDLALLLIARDREAVDR